MTDVQLTQRSDSKAPPEGHRMTGMLASDSKAPSGGHNMQSMLVSDSRTPLNVNKMQGMFGSDSKAPSEGHATHVAYDLVQKKKVNRDLLPGPVQGSDQTRSWPAGCRPFELHSEPLFGKRCHPAGEAMTRDVAR